MEGKTRGSCSFSSPSLGLYSDLFCRNIAEQLIEKGLASVVRHRRDDEDRAPDYDKLIAAEQS